MAIKGVIFDVSKTLIKPYPSSTAAPGVVDLINHLRSLGIKIFAFENDGPQSKVESRLQTCGIYFDEVVTSKEIGINKGSPAWIDYIKVMHSLSANELIYIGDSDLDMRTASQSRVLYLHAGWASPQGKYGILAPTPKWVSVVVQHIFLKKHLWFWQLNTSDSKGFPVRKLAMIDGNGAGDEEFKYLMVAVFKSKTPSTKVGPILLADFVMLHLLASIYFEGIYQDIDFWTIQPGHSPNSFSPMTQHLDTAAKLFRDKYKNDLIQRGTLAINSRDARKKGFLEALKNQLESTNVNPLYRGQLQGKNILYLDDFITAGPTTEISRNLLIEAGASKITNVSIGKYGYDINLVSLTINGWDAFQSTKWDSKVQYKQQLVHGSTNPLALTEFLTSYNTMLHETI